MFINRNNIDANDINQGAEYVTIQDLLAKEEFSKVSFGSLDVVHGQMSNDENGHVVDLTWFENVDKDLASFVEQGLQSNGVKIGYTNSNELDNGLLDMNFYEEEVRDNFLIAQQRKALTMLGDNVSEDMAQMFKDDVAEAELRGRQRASFYDLRSTMSSVNELKEQEEMSQ